MWCIPTTPTLEVAKGYAVGSFLPTLVSNQLATCIQSTGGKPKARGPNPALHLVLSGPAPCFYPAAALSSHLTVRSSYIYTVLKWHLALWRQLRGWCDPQWKWVWHPWSRESIDILLICKWVYTHVFPTPFLKKGSALHLFNLPMYLADNSIVSYKKHSFPSQRIALKNIPQYI